MKYKRFILRRDKILGRLFVFYAVCIVLSFVINDMFLASLFAFSVATLGILEVLNRFGESEKTIKEK